MTLDEYFGDWMKVIDRTELNNVMAKVGQEYRRKPLCPAQSNVFRAFELCPLNDLKVVMLGQDFDNKLRVLNKQGELLEQLNESISSQATEEHKSM